MAKKKKEDILEELKEAQEVKDLEGVDEAVLSDDEIKREEVKEYFEVISNVVTSEGLRINKGSFLFAKKSDISYLGDICVTRVARVPEKAVVIDYEKAISALRKSRV